MAYFLRSIWKLAAALLVVGAVVGPWGGAPVAQTTGVAAQLAPMGRLRVGVYPNSPLSMVKTTSGETHGLSFDLGHELGRRLGVPVQVIAYERVAEIVAAIKAGDVDFTVTNASPARREIVDFTQTVLSLELGYLVPAASKIAVAGDLERPGIRVGVTQGSSSERALPKRFPQTILVGAPSLKAAVEMMTKGDVDAFATNKAILFQMSDALPGSRVLEGRWGEEHFAMAITKGRETGMAYLNDFVADVQRSGELSRAMHAAGLRGAIGGN
jgi:polar amino acid transport system substrate-binding protein